MKPRIVSSFLAAAACAFTAHADVTLTFDSTAEGFVQGADADATVAWNAYNGGSLAVTAPTGWKSQAAYLDILAHPTLAPAFQDALVNGGSISYTLTIEQAGIQGANPEYLETTQIGNSAGGWDQSVGPSKGLAGVYTADFPLATPYSVTVNYPIEVGAATDDAIAQFGSPSGWYQLNIGLNSGGAGFTAATVYLDNFTISVNPPPGVTLTFDSDTEGFVLGADADAAIAWSAYNGGSLAITSPTGWKVQSAHLDLLAHPTLYPEFEKALANGGTISYTVYVEQAGIQGANPGWFETAQIGNSTGGWDQSFGPSKGLIGLYGGDFPIVGTYSKRTSYPIEDGPAVEDSRAQFASASDYFQLNLGLNSGGDGFTGATYYLDDFTISANEEPSDPIIPALKVYRAAKGLNLISAGAGQYDRRMVRTYDELHSWVGVASPANPVTYSITIGAYPPQAGYASFIYLIPGSDQATTNYSDPDWQAPTVARFSFERTTAGQPAATGAFAYKVNQPNSNGTAPNDYFNDDTVPSSGLGGILARVTSATTLGTWSITFTSDTDFTIKAPDGTTSAGAMLQSTADLFAGDLRAYFGNLPGSVANIGLSGLYSKIAISGSALPFEVNFQDPIDPFDGYLEVAPDGRSGVLVTSSDTPYWVEWSLPATGYVLHQSRDLGETEDWFEMDMLSAIVIGDVKVLRLLDVLELSDPNESYFQLQKPAPAPAGAP